MIRFRTLEDPSGFHEKTLEQKQTLGYQEATAGIQARDGGHLGLESSSGDRQVDRQV